MSKAQNIQVMFRLLKKIKRKANYWLYSPFGRVIIPLRKLLCTRCNCSVALKELIVQASELFPSEERGYWLTATIAQNSVAQI